MGILGDFSLGEGAASGSGILGGVVLAGVGWFVGGGMGVIFFFGGLGVAGLGVFLALRK